MAHSLQLTQRSWRIWRKSEPLPNRLQPSTHLAQPMQRDGLAARRLRFDGRAHQAALMPSFCSSAWSAVTSGLPVTSSLSP